VIQGLTLPTLKDHTAAKIFCVMKIQQDPVSIKGSPVLPGFPYPPDHVAGIGGLSGHIQVKLEAGTAKLRIGSSGILELPVQAVDFRAGKNGVVAGTVLSVVGGEDIEAGSISYLQEGIGDISCIDPISFIIEMDHFPVLVAHVYQAPPHPLEFGNPVRRGPGDVYLMPARTVTDHSADYQNLLGLFQLGLIGLHAGSAQQTQGQDDIEFIH
jgi:hypothetical protein